MNKDDEAIVYVGRPTCKQCSEFELMLKNMNVVATKDTVTGETATLPTQTIDIKGNA